MEIDGRIGVCLLADLAIRATWFSGTDVGENVDWIWIVLILPLLLDPLIEKVSKY